MKRCLLLMVAILLVAVPAALGADGSVYLVCDPMADAEQTQVVLNGDAQGWVDYQEAVMSDGNTYCLLMELTGLTNGQHTAAAQVKNLWGESALSAPLEFSKSAPPVPGGIRLLKMP